jgi:hypothetical protein
MVHSLAAEALRFPSIADEDDMLIAKYGAGWLDAFALGEDLSSAEIQKSVGDFVAQGLTAAASGVVIRHLIALYLGSPLFRRPSAAEGQ